MPVPANLNKQPVILTDEEKRHIDETSPVHITTLLNTERIRTTLTGIYVPVTV
jgi:hypothetical protein